jgi:hypothetical protein
VMKRKRVTRAKRVVLREIDRKQGDCDGHVC